MSRTRLKSLIETGAVTVGGRTITEPRHRVKLGEDIALDAPEPEPAEPQGQDLPLDIVFEDEHLLVIDKPAGLVVHPGAGNETGTLVNALIAHCGDSLSGIGGVKRPGIVHRLDKDTSGLLVVAKNDRAHRGLAEQFADHGRQGPLERRYVAFAWGAPSRSHGTIDAALGRAPNNPLKHAVRRDGREAITHYELERRFPDVRAPLVARLSLWLETGRTHQIRVHMAHLGHPLLGDALYGAGFRTKAVQLPPAAQAALDALGRQALHAAELGFAHPVTGAHLTFASKLPSDLMDLEAALAHW